MLKMRYARWGVCAAGAGWVLAGAMAFAQDAAPAGPPKAWTGSLGAGLSLTSGNTDTVNYNVAFELNFDPGGKNTAKMTGQHLRGSQNGVLSVNRSALAFRDQYAISPRGFIFGQIEYLRDTFKRLDYLVAPTAGAGYNIVDNATTKLSVTGGLGIVTEADTGFSARTSGALTAGQTLAHTLSSTAKLTQSSTQTS